MARKKPSKSPLAALGSGLMLLIIAVLAGVILYKQVFLGNRITGNLPREQLAASLEQCARTHYTPLPGEFGAQDPYGVSGILSSVLQGVSGSTLNTHLQQHQVDEIKLFKIEDFFGENAQLRVTGAMQIATRVPVVGDMSARKDYQLMLYKQGGQYSFSGLKVKEPDSETWEEWPCPGQFQ